MIGYIGALLAGNENEFTLHRGWEYDLWSIRSSYVVKGGGVRGRAYKTVLDLHAFLIRFRRRSDIEVPNDSDYHNAHNHLSQVLTSTYPSPNSKRYHVLEHVIEFDLRTL